MLRRDHDSERERPLSAVRRVVVGAANKIEHSSYRTLITGLAVAVVVFALVYAACG